MAISDTSCSFGFFQGMSQNPLSGSFSPKRIQCIKVEVNYAKPVTSLLAGKISHFPFHKKKKSLCFAFQINLSGRENACKTMLQLLWKQHLIFWCRNSRVPSQERTQNYLVMWKGKASEKHTHSGLVCEKMSDQFALSSFAMASLHLQGDTSWISTVQQFGSFGNI